MPITGRGLLMTSMDVDPAHEAELNAWYDREHLAERVAIPGFIEARRYVAVEAAPAYLGLYSTESLAVLSSPAYRHALAHQTEWSKLNLSRALNMGRAIGIVTASRGQGRGAHLGLLRLRPGADDQEAVRTRLEAWLPPGDRAGLIAGHLVESDPGLSVSLTRPQERDPGAADWYVLVDGSEATPVAQRLDEIAGETRLAPLVVSRGTYRLLWDLAKADL